MRLPAVFIFNGRVDVDTGIPGIQGVQNHFVAFLHKGPPEFASSGQLIVVRIELFVKIGKFTDLGGLGQILVGLADLFFHQAINLGPLGEFLVAGVVELLLIGPLSHHRVVDAHHGSNEVAFVADDPRVLDVGAEFEAGFQVLGRKGFSIAQGEDILSAVEDHQMAVVVDEALVVRVEPAVPEGFFSGFGILVVSQEDRRAASDDLAILGDLDFGARNGVAHSVKLDIAIAMHHGDAGHFGLPVNLLEINAQGMKKAEVIRSHGRTAGVGVTHPGEPQVVFEFLLHRDLGQPMQQGPGQGNGPLFEFQIGHVIADLGGQFVELALDPGGIQVFDLHRTGHLLIHARRGKHDMRADFADVLLGGFRLFGEVDCVTHLQTAGDGHHLLTDPGKRQVGDIVITVLARINGHEMLPHGEHVVVRKQSPLGQGGGARCVE